VLPVLKEFPLALHLVVGFQRWAGFGIAHALFIRAFKDRYIYGHTGCYSPYNSSIFVDPKTGYGVVTFFNSSVTDIRNIIPEMAFDMLET